MILRNCQETQAVITRGGASVVTLFEASFEGGHCKWWFTRPLILYGTIVNLTILETISSPKASLPLGIILSY